MALLNRCYTFRLYPSKGQEMELCRILRLCAELWNAALEQRMWHYRNTGKQLSGMTQSKVELTPLIAACHQQPEVYGVPWMGGYTGFHLMPATAHRRVLTRLDDAYKAFFRRLKEGRRGRAAGFPTFRPWKRWDSFTIQHDNGGHIDEASSRLFLHWNKGEGEISIPVVLHRKIPGTPQFLTVRRRAHTWEVTVQCSDVASKELPQTGAVVGIDMGLKVFATLSDGSSVENPRHLKRAEKALARAQKKASRTIRVAQRLHLVQNGKPLDTRSAHRKIAEGALTRPSDYGKLPAPEKKHGSNRLKAKYTRVAKMHWRVDNARREHHYQTAARIVRKFDVIGVEKLNLIGLSRSALRKSFADAGVGAFLLRLKSTAEMAGKRVVEVPAAGTTIDCSACGARVPKELKDRMHVCKCGLAIDRDLNAAINIRDRAVSLPVEPAVEKVKVRRYKPRTARNAGKPAQPGDNGLLGVEAASVTLASRAVQQPKDGLTTGEAPTPNTTSAHLGGDHERRGHDTPSTDARTLAERREEALARIQRWLADRNARKTGAKS